MPTSVNNTNIDMDTDTNTTKLNILVVDDDTTIIVLLSEMLGQKHDVTTTCDVWEAMDLLSKCKYDVLLTDFKMPGINGATLSDLLRKEMKQDSTDTVIIMLTGTDIDKANPGIRSVDYLLRKPIQWSKLNDVLNEIAERKAHGDNASIK